jgi:hypothetical protein
VDDRRVHFSATALKNIIINKILFNQLGSKYDMPSKTLSYARQGTDTLINTRPVRNQMLDYADVRFVESNGRALEPVERALYSKARPAKTRFHWMFPPDKDERVASLLAWIQSVSYGLATFGVSSDVPMICRKLLTSTHLRLATQIFTKPGARGPPCKCGL